MQDASVSAGLPEEVRLFLGAVLESYPDPDIRLLAAARRWGRSEEGREDLTRVMGAFLYRIASSQGSRSQRQGEPRPLLFIYPSKPSAFRDFLGNDQLVSPMY